MDGKAGVVGWQVNLADEGVGRLDGGDSGELQFLRQSVLKRLKRKRSSRPTALGVDFERARQAASRSGALALVHAHGISSSRRAAGQRLTSLLRRSAI